MTVQEFKEYCEDGKHTKKYVATLESLTVEKAIRFKNLIRTYRDYSFGALEEELNIILAPLPKPDKEWLTNGTEGYNV